MNKDHLLFGNDPTDRIVGIAPHGEGHVRLWRRLEDDSVVMSIERMHPFLYTTKRGIQCLTEHLGPFFFKTHQMEGNNEMDQLATFKSTDDFRRARKVLYADPVLADKFFTYGDPSVAYLVHSGRTFFKGMSPDSAHRMQIDIESFRIDGFPDAHKDPIFIISISDNRGYEKVLYQIANPVPRDFNALAMLDDKYQLCGDEEEMLRELVKIIQRRDPDILEGHNFFGFDLPYIHLRCRNNGVNFSIGRDGLEPFQIPATKKFAERDIDYTNFVVGGRSIIDTMFLAIDWDVYARKLDGVGLKSVAKVLGVTPEDRTYIEGDQIAQTWLDDPASVLNYALDDVKETLGLSNHLCSSVFALTQMMPMPYQKIHLAGKASVIQSMFVREYLRTRNSLPCTDPNVRKQEFGGYTDIFYTGVFDNIWYLDVKSLYPSIMLNYNVAPAHDYLGLFQDILGSLTGLRLQTKAVMKRTKEKSRRAQLSAREQAFKIIINSFYGMLGDKFSLFMTMDEADRVAKTGQDLLKQMMRLIEGESGQVIEVDTDGVMCVMPPGADFAEGAPAFVKHISNKMPEGIDIDLDGIYPRMVSFKKKNYALREIDGSLKIKGGSFKSRSLEPLFREYVQAQLNHLVDKDALAMRETHQEFQRRIMEDVAPEELSRTVTLKETLETYTRKCEEADALRGTINPETGKTYRVFNRSPQYEIALQMDQEGRRVQKGDRISYIVTGTKPVSKVKSFVDAEPLESVAPMSHNKAYYLRKLQKIATDNKSGRFGTFFDDKHIDYVFPKITNKPDLTNGLFGPPDLSGLKITNKTVEHNDD